MLNNLNKELEVKLLELERNTNEQDKSDLKNLLDSSTNKY